MAALALLWEGSPEVYLRTGALPPEMGQPGFNSESAPYSTYCSGNPSGGALSDILAPESWRLGLLGSIVRKTVLHHSMGVEKAQ